MNYKSFKTAIATGALLLGISSASGQTVVMNTPDNFQVLDISPNGKWACGVFVDAGNSVSSFRWNLESGSIEMLNFTDETIAWGVANDGTVSGVFTDKSHSANGAGILLPGFYRDGKWHSVEFPADAPEIDGQAGGITPDGRFMTGEICGVGYIWEDGKISRRLNANTSYMRPYCISPDGKAAAGWAYGTIKNNRACIYWPESGEPVWLMDADEEYRETMFNHCQKFSPNGKWITYWGGYNWYEDTQEAYLYSLYNVETDERIRVKLLDKSDAVEFFGVSDNGTLVGERNNMGYVYSDGNFISIYDFVKDRGYDLWDFDGFYSGDDSLYDDSFPPISRVIGISGDENVICMQYYSNLTGQVASLVVKFDQDRYHIPAADTNGRQLEGLQTVELSWKYPVGFFGTRANIYRDGEKINGRRAVEGNTYYDADLAPGRYEYEVRLVNTNEEEVAGQKFFVDVVTPTPPAPCALLARQKGINNALAIWNAPMSNIVHKAYYNHDITEYAPFSIYQSMGVEMGVRYDSSELANYDGYTLDEVSFIPLGNHSNWAINIYTVGADNTLSKVYSQPVDQELSLRELNTVVLDTPYQITKNSNIIVTVQVLVNSDEAAVLAAQYGKVKAGYSDLMRPVGEEEFFSTYESSIEGTYQVYSMSWMIDLGISNPAAENAVFSGYTVYLDGEAYDTADDCEYLFKNLEAGDYTIGVEANYGDKVSDRISGTFAIAKRELPAVDVVNVAVEEESAEILASWDAPKDNDPYQVTYTNQEYAERGITGIASTNYSIMVGAKYPASMLRSYDGYQVTSFRFFPLCDAIYTILLYENNDLVYEQEVEDFKVRAWNKVLPTEEIVINPNCDYTLVVDVYDPEPDTPVIGIDNNAGLPMYSDLYSVDGGESFESYYNATDISANFMLGMTVAAADADVFDVEGYDIYIDGKKKNDDKLSDREFKYDFGQVDSKSHTVSVDVYYPGQKSAVNGADNYFHLKTSGIDLNEVVSITLRQGDNYLVADGDGVKGISVISTDGRVMATSNTNMVDITSLTSGVYVVAIQTIDGNISRKLQISK